MTPEWSCNLYGLLMIFFGGWKLALGVAVLSRDTSSLLEHLVRNILPSNYCLEVAH
jgi:hypothetical protein